MQFRALRKGGKVRSKNGRVVIINALTTHHRDRMIRPVPTVTTAAHATPTTSGSVAPRRGAGHTSAAGPDIQTAGIDADFGREQLINSRSSIRRAGRIVGRDSRCLLQDAHSHRIGHRRRNARHALHNTNRNGTRRGADDRTDTRIGLGGSARTASDQHHAAALRHVAARDGGAGVRGRRVRCRYPHGLHRGVPGRTAAQADPDGARPGARLAGAGAVRGREDAR